MAQSRAMKTIGHGAQLVFADGNRIDYPRYKVSSNGFVRGPRNEQVGRGEAAIQQAAQLCREQEQAWLDRMARFNNEFQGVSVPDSLHSAWDSLNRYTKNVKGDSIRDGATLQWKAYWRDEPDCYDIIGLQWAPTRYNSSVSVNLIVRSMPLRRLPFTDAPSPFDSAGTVLQEYVPIGDWVAWQKDTDTNIRRGAEIALGLLDELQVAFDDHYTNVIGDFTTQDVKDQFTQFLSGSEVTAELMPVLKKAAELLQKLGYSVEDSSTDVGISFSVKDNEHTLVITNNSMEAVCHFEKDEERLTQLRKTRLEAEYWNSVHEHGDMTQYDPHAEDEDETSS